MNKDLTTKIFEKISKSSLAATNVGNEEINSFQVLYFNSSIYNIFTMWKVLQVMYRQVNLSRYLVHGTIKSCVCGNAHSPG
jgi:hypothetical protein